MVEQFDEDHDDGGGHGDDQVLGIGKEEREKQKWAQGKGDIHRAILFWWSKHLVCVIIFRIDSRTIKRGETRIGMQLSKCH